MQPALDHQEVMHEAVLRLENGEAIRRQNAERDVENMLYRVGLEFHGAAAMASDWHENADDIAARFAVSAERVRWMAHKVEAGCVAVAMDDDAQVTTMDVGRAWFIYTVGFDPYEQFPDVTLADIQDTRIGQQDWLKAQG